MTRVLITSGPTRQYLDPVRFLTNASSGRMGCALVQAALARGWHATVVTGPVAMEYPDGAEVIRAVTTEEMLGACLDVFPRCDGLIAAAAPCDYRPAQLAETKLAKTGKPLCLELVETPDIVAALASKKGRRWIVAFALETHDQHNRALRKLQQKDADLIVINGPAVIDAVETAVEILTPSGEVAASLSGDKIVVAREILSLIDERLTGGVEGIPA